MTDKPWDKYNPSSNDINPNVWNLNDEFTVIEAASLIANIDPSVTYFYKTENAIAISNYTNDTRASNADTVFKSLIKAIENNELKAKFPKESPKEEFPWDSEDIPF